MKQILVIDDDEQIRELIRHSLERAGYTVRDASNGEAGLKLCRQVEFDLVIIDIFMPEKEGLETIREMKRDYPKCKIIAISGGGSMGELSYLSLAKNFGATRSLAKPFLQGEVLKAVQEVLQDEPVG